MVTKKRDTSEKRNAILDAAIKAFSEKGFENASMDYIAELANASKRTVYNHFSSKDILFHQMMARFFSEIMPLKKITYRADATLSEQLGAFADAKIKISDNPSWLAIIKISLSIFASNPQLAQQTMKTAEGLENTFKTWLEAAVADGKLVIDNLDMANQVFNTMISGAFFWPTTISDPIPKERIEPLKKELIATFLSRYSAVR